jgi:hypothetical protein
MASTDYRDLETHPSLAHFVTPITNQRK